VFIAELDLVPPNPIHENIGLTITDEYLGTDIVHQTALILVGPDASLASHDTGWLF